MNEKKTLGTLIAENRKQKGMTQLDLAASREVHVVIDLPAGEAEATIWTNDLTHDYVHENSAYST